MLTIPGMDWGMRSVSLIGINVLIPVIASPGGTSTVCHALASRHPSHLLVDLDPTQAFACDLSLQSQTTDKF